MHKIFRTLKGMMAVAAVAAVAASGTVSLANAQAAPPAAKQKNWKDTAEYDLYQTAFKAVNANPQDGAKALTALDTWKSKYAESEYKDLRDVLYVQAYVASKQFSKALAAAAPLLAQDLDAAYPDPQSGPGEVIKILFAASTAVTQIPEPTPADLETGQKAAKLLQNYNRKPQGVADAAWAEARKTMQNAANASLVHIAVIPGQLALDKKDCSTAEAVYTKALNEYPQNPGIAYQLGAAYNCAARANPATFEDVYPKALYFFARAVAIDPTLGGTQKAEAITGYVTKAYVGFHGDVEGLEQLKQQAKASHMVPAGFTIESGRQIANRKEKEFKEKYPQLALWLGIKSSLSGPEGEAYFTNQMKETAIPKGTLKGMIVEGKPACRSKELLVSVPEPDQKGTAPAVITLKLDAPLKGKPDLTEIQFGGAPSAFTQSPSFMLTMDVEQGDITDLKVTPCTPTAAPKGGAKKGSTKKK